MKTPAPITTTDTASRPSRWWWWVVGAFALQFTVWIAWFIVAAHHPVEEVPVATRPGR